MNSLRKTPIDRLGFDFIPPEFIPEGMDEYHMRNAQQPVSRRYRHLEAREIETLVKNENRTNDWGGIYVTDRFNPELVRGCQFFGMVRIGDLEAQCLEFHDLHLPVGIYDSTIVSSDIGSNVAIRNVNYLSHYIIGDEVILLNVAEMQTSNHAKFGNGIIMDGEEERVRIWLEVWNEMEGRSILPFDGILPADAYIWAKYRDDKALMDRLKEMTDARFDRRRGAHGVVGAGTVIKHCGVIKDAKIGSHAYIKGAAKLKNLTINSDEREGTQIGEGCELVNGIIGYGCRVFYGVKAVRFIMGTRSNLKYGARLINSYLGDNSTVSCCEILHNLIFPSHEQHHNNSFLVAACLKGQSNLAAGATIGSNHNSRANDGEIIAGRGFWPGLCTSLKHNCRFSSFNLLAKGSYPAELDNPIPFALISNDESRNRLTIMPAYWFLYNAYALVRNSWKFQARDRRIHSEQKMEFDYLAPDTVEEILSAMELLELWTAKAAYRRIDTDPDGISVESLREKGRQLLREAPEQVAELEILGENIENSRRKVVLLRTEKAYPVYRSMLNYYAVKYLMTYLEEQRLESLEQMKAAFPAERVRDWISLGGQLVTLSDYRTLRERIVSGELGSWDDIHAEYARLWEQYPCQKTAHAYATLLHVHGIRPEDLDIARWYECLDQAGETQRTICRLTRESRSKDYTSRFRKMSFDNQEEMDAVMGPLEENTFIKQVSEETEEFLQRLESLRNRVH